LLGGLIVLGLAPLELADKSSAVASILVVVALDVALCILAILKGKPILGLTGVFVPLASLLGAIRLATPTSPWARRRYPPDSRKLQRAQTRFARVRRRRRRMSDVIAGTPSRPGE
jgi:hypothetical protein